MAFTDDVDKWAGHASAAGLTTIKTATVTLRDSINSNLPANPQKDVVLGQAELALLQMVARVASEFK